MQMTLAFLGCVLFTLFQAAGCDPQREHDESIRDNRDLVTSSTPKPREYRIAGNDCFADESCLTFVSVDKKLADEDALIVLSVSLREKNPTKKKLVVYFFDSFNLAKSFADGKVPPRDLDFYAIGVYRYDEKEEYLKIRLVEQNTSEPQVERPKWRIVFKRPTSGYEFPQKSPESQDIGVKYEILTKNCFSEPRCFAFVFMDKKIMNALNLLHVVKEFERMNEQREYLRVIFFDDLQLAKAYAEGKRAHDINFDAKAVYFHEADQIYLKVKCFEADAGKFSEWTNILDK